MLVVPPTTKECRLVDNTGIPMGTVAQHVRERLYERTLAISAFADQKDQGVLPVVAHQRVAGHALKECPDVRVRLPSL